MSDDTEYLTQHPANRQFILESIQEIKCGKTRRISLYREDNMEINEKYKLKVAKTMRDMPRYFLEYTEIMKELALDINTDENRDLILGYLYILRDEGLVETIGNDEFFRLTAKGHDYSYCELK